MLTTEQFIAVAERDVKVLQFMLQALGTMTLLHLARVEVEGAQGKLNFTREIAGLTEAINLMGHTKPVVDLPVDLGK